MRDAGKLQKCSFQASLISVVVTTVVLIEKCLKTENLAIILVSLIMILSRGHTGQIKG